MIRILRRAGVELEAVNERALKQRVHRARADLGTELAGRLTRAFAETAPPLLATVRKAHPNLREYAARAAIRFAILTDEHAVQSHAALVLLAASAQWSALGELLRDGAFKAGAEVLTQSQTIKTDSGTMSASAPAFADLLKLATTADNTARLNLLAALQVEREGRDARAAPDAGVNVSKRLEAILREREARQLAASAVAETPADEPPAVDDAPPSSDPELVTDDGALCLTERSSIPEPSPAKPPPATETTIALPQPLAAVALAVEQSQLTYEPKLGRVVTKGDRERLAKDVSRPSPHALEEMKKRGVDTSRWEQGGNEP